MSCAACSSRVVALAAVFTSCCTQRMFLTIARVAIKMVISPAAALSGGCRRGDHPFPTPISFKTSLKFENALLTKKQSIWGLWFLRKEETLFQVSACPVEFDQAEVELMWIRGFEKCSCHDNVVCSSINFLAAQKRSLNLLLEGIASLRNYDVAEDKEIRNLSFTTRMSACVVTRMHDIRILEESHVPSKCHRSPSKWFYLFHTRAAFISTAPQLPYSMFHLFFWSEFYESFTILSILLLYYRKLVDYYRFNIIQNFDIILVFC